MSGTLLKSNIVLTGFKSHKKINDARLNLMVSFLSNAYGEEVDVYQNMIDKIYQHFKVKITVNRLHVYYMLKKEEEDKKLQWKHVS